MPSFDFASKVDLQTLDNAINIVSKEITNRFDFKGSHVLIELNKKDFKINLEADSEMKLTQITDVLISRSMKQGLAAEVYDLSKVPHQSGYQRQIAFLRARLFRRISTVRTRIPRCSAASSPSDRTFRRAAS